MDWPPGQKAYYMQRAKDAQPVECVRMRDVFTPEQIAFLKMCSYRTKMHQCYKNAADLVMLSEIGPMPRMQYIEGFSYSCGLLPIEHAFVKVGDKYIDPTFERVLKKDPRTEIYVSCIELEPEEMAYLQGETGCYGELYQYKYLKQNRPELAAIIRKRRW